MIFLVNNPIHLKEPNPSKSNIPYKQIKTTSLDKLIFGHYLDNVKPITKSIISNPSEQGYKYNEY